MYKINAILCAHLKIVFQLFPQVKKIWKQASFTPFLFVLIKL